MKATAAAITPLKPGVTLYLIRHGETDWNREARYQGQRDIPLNAKGREQARRNGRALMPLAAAIAHADFVASPLIRATETMSIVRAELDLAGDFRIEPELREIHYGHWEGQLASELSITDPEGIAQKSNDPFGWRPRGGESYADLAARICQWLAHVERDTIAVTHGGVSRVARGAVLGLNPRDVPYLEVPQDKILVLTQTGAHWL